MERGEVFSRFSLMEFILAQPASCVTLFMGLLTVLLNMLLIGSLKRDKGVQCVGVVISLLCCNILTGLVTVAATVVYYVGTTRQESHGLCESQVIISFLGTTGIIAKMYYLICMEHCLQTSKRPNAMVITLGGLISVCASAAHSAQLIEIWPCKFPWVSASRYSNLTLFLLIWGVILARLLIQNLPKENQDRHCSITADSKNHRKHYDTIEMEVGETMNMKKAKRRQLMMLISFLICGLPAALLFGVSWLPDRFGDLFDFGNKTLAYTYSFYLLNCMLDPLIYTSVKVNEKQTSSCQLRI